MESVISGIGAQELMTSRVKNLPVDQTQPEGSCWNLEDNKSSLLTLDLFVLLENIFSIPMEEIILMFDRLEEQLIKLRCSLLRTQAILFDAVENQQFDFMHSLKQLQVVVFDTDELLDELMYHVVQRKKMGNQIPYNSKHFHKEMADRMKGIIDKELEYINHVMQGSIYFPEIPALVKLRPPRGRGRQTTSFSLDPNVVGRSDDVSKIVKMVLEADDAPKDEYFSVIPIVGLGGLGKTTLARSVFNDERISFHFQKRIWVTVSQDFNAVILLKKILESLIGVVDLETMSSQVILQKLGRELRYCRYLLVIDDLWHDRFLEWRQFVNSLARISSSPGNCFLVTTRNQSVASMVQTLPIHMLSPLSEYDCWSIIKAAGAFKGLLDNQTAGFEEELGSSIAKKCRGLPLAAKVMANLLCERSIDEWLSILEAPFFGLGKDGDLIFEILRFSFDHLPSSSLKMCLAYCSMFQSGYSLKRERLIKLWMAEGFLQTSHGCDDMESTGEDFFNYLLQSSLFQDVERDDYDNISSCKMHNLVHEFCFSVFPYSTLSLEVDKKGFPSVAQAKFRRSFFFTGDVLGNMYMKMKFLHVLVLRGSNIKEIPCWIGRLIHLRFLDISYTGIEKLPESVGKLYNLQTLQAVEEGRGHGTLKKLPKTLVELINLRHLQIPSIELPPKVGKLTSLRTLSYYKVGCKKGCKIEELRTLKNLGGKLEIQNLERVNNKEEAMRAGLFEKPNILKLKYVWDESRGDSKVNDDDVLESLQPHPNLKGLEICGFSGTSFPLWTRKMAIYNDIERRWADLHNLMHIILRNCSKCEEIPMLGHLPHLKKLYLIGLTNIRSIGPSFYGSEYFSNRNLQDTVDVFPKLERLELSQMPELRQWTEAEAEMVTAVFPSLEYLKIESCPQLKSAPSHFPCLKELIIRKVDSDLPLENIFRSNLTSLRRLVIQDMLGVAHLPEQLFLKNRNLAYLIIRNCPSLTHLVPSLSYDSVAFLRELNIENCAKLRELPEDLIRKQFLGSLLILDCPELKSFPYSSGQVKGISSLPTLSNVAEMPPLIAAVELKKRNDTNTDQEPDSVQEHAPSSICGMISTSESHLGSERIQQASASISQVQHEQISPSGITEELVTIEERETAILSRGKNIPVDQTHPEVSRNLEDSIQEHIVSRTVHSSRELDHKSSLHGTTNIAISITGELFKFVDLKLQILNALSSSEMQHADSDYLSMDLDPKTNNYLFLVKKKVRYNGSDVLIPEDLIYKSGSGASEFPKADEWPQFSIMSLMEKDLVLLPERPDCANLVVLFLQRNYRLSNIPPSFFDRMVALRFLNLSDTRISTLPMSLFALTELQVLLLQNCARLEKLPSDIGKLNHLEVLDLLGTELCDLPDQVGELASLRNLQLSFYGSDDEREFVNLPSQLVSHGIISKLQELQAFSIIVHPENHRWTKNVGDLIQEVIGLKMLSHLQFYFSKIEHLQNFVEMSPSWRENGLRTFKFVVGQDVKRIASRVSDEVDWRFDQHERCLRFVNGNELHPVIEEVLQRATAFYLDHHLQVSSLSKFKLSNLKELKFCVVRECPNIEVIIDGEIKLPSLEYLGIHYLWELQFICNVPVQKGCFHALKCLTVNMCPKLQFVLPVSMVSCLSNLEVFVVEDCEAVTKVVEGEIITVKNDVTMLPRLRKLELRYLPKLVSLGNGICLTEDQVTVHGCPNLQLNVKHRKLRCSFGGCGICFEARTAVDLDSHS